jgi:predicted RNA binding protein YcfA (HicA-like mRNA interferase family)
LGGAQDICLPNPLDVYSIHTTTRAEIIRRLREDGWKLVRIKGSHHQFKHPEKPGRVTVQHPAKDYPMDTLRSIFRQAGWDWRTR